MVDPSCSARDRHGVHGGPIASTSLAHCVKAPPRPVFAFRLLGIPALGQAPQHHRHPRFTASQGLLRAHSVNYAIGGLVGSCRSTLTVRSLLWRSF